MKTEITSKLEKIAEIWNFYILDYKFCNSQIKFTEDVASNYFGDILRYFIDSIEIVFAEQKNSSFYLNLESTMSFLQSVYIEQDFIIELLFIFKCKTTKAELKKDSDFTINREIRNELIGHPIRRNSIVNGNLRLTSSVIFSNNVTFENIEYIRYHIENNYKSEVIKHSRTEILKRHSKFLVKYLDEIIEKLKKILAKFMIKIKEIENVIKHGEFENILEITLDHFEEVYETDYLFDKDLLLEAYKLMGLHPRYQCGVNKFLNTLEGYIIDKKMDIENFLSYEYKFKEVIKFNEAQKIIFQEADSIVSFNKKPVENYQYEMSKLVSKNDDMDFNLFSSMLKNKCKDDKDIIAEINNMANNRTNNLEYYCSYHYLRVLIDLKIKKASH